jgi:hypothetical protein
VSDSRAAGNRAILALGLSLGTLSAAVAAVPAALRVSASGPAMLGAWVLFTGASALIIGPLLASVLRLRHATPQRGLGFRAVSLALLMAAGPLAVLGAALKTGTHHRPLGGATFAVLALAVVAASLLCAHRIVAWANAEDAFRRRLGRALTLLFGVAGVGVVTLLLVRLGTSPGPPQVGVLDGLRALGLGAIASFLRLPGQAERVLGRSGLPIWAGAVLAAFALCRVPSLAAVAERAAPVLTAPVGWLSAGLGDG